MPSYNEHRYGHLEYVHPLENCSHSFRVIFSRDDSIEQRSSPPLWIIGVSSCRDAIHRIIIPVFHFHEYLPHMRVAARAPTGEDVPTGARKLYTEDVSAYPVNDILRAQRGYYSPKNHRGALLIFHSPSPALYTRPPRLVN